MKLFKSHLENKDWDAAICCYLLSDSWDKNDKAKSELFYITQQTGKIIEERYYKDNFEEILQKHNVPTQPNQLWIEIALYMGEQRTSCNDIEEAKFCYYVAYELTGNDSYHEKMLELNKKLV